MFQILIDHSDVNTLNALYLSIYLGLVLKHLWTWSVEYTLNGNTSYAKNTKIIRPLFFFNKTSSFNGSIILIRIIKYIRRKECPQDDSEEPISLLIAY